MPAIGMNEFYKPQEENQISMSKRDIFEHASKSSNSLNILKANHLIITQDMAEVFCLAICQISWYFKN